MDILIYGIVVIVWIAMAAATIKIFTRKGQSITVAILVGLIFGPLALLVGLLMPADQAGIEEYKRRQEAERIERDRYLTKLQNDYADKQTSYGNQSLESEQRHNTLSYISAGALILCPILAIFAQSEPIQIGLGLATVAGLIGLVVSN